MNNKISSKQAHSIMVMYWTGSSLVVGSANGAKQDTWIGLIISCLFMVPTIFLYDRIITLYPGKDLFQILFEVFGKVVGRIFAVLLELYVLELGALVSRTFTEFVQVENMPETPQILIAAMLILLCVWGVKCGIEAFGRTSRLLFLLLAIFIIVTFILMTKDMDMSNIKPIMSSSMPTLLQSGVDTYSLPLAESFLFISLFPYIQTKTSPKKLLGGSLLTILILFLVVDVRNLLILGPLIGTLYFPSYQATSIVSIGEFFTRMEVSIGINLMMTGFVKQCACLFFASIGLARIFNVKDYKMMAAPCGLIFVLFSILSFSNSLEYINFAKIYPYVALPFEVGLPLLIMIIAEIKIRLHKVLSNADNSGLENS